MKTIAVLATLALGAAVLPQSASAAGCVSGAAVGGLAGHAAGHHGVLGAAAGCAVGHHMKNKQAKAASQSQPAQQ